MPWRLLNPLVVGAITTETTIIFAGAMMYETGSYIEVTCTKCSCVNRYTGVTSCLCKHAMKKAGWVNEGVVNSDPFSSRSTLSVWVCQDCNKRISNGQR